MSFDFLPDEPPAGAVCEVCHGPATIHVHPEALSCPSCGLAQLDVQRGNTGPDGIYYLT
jgi:Zn finger protein HypA/HybF involved in hydrogenase expression